MNSMRAGEVSIDQASRCRGPLLELASRHIGIVGAFTFSAGNFLLAYSLQRLSTPTEFGTFALIQVMLQFGVGISNALFCSPVIVAAANDADGLTVASFFKANAIYCWFAALLVGCEVWFMSSNAALSVAASVLCFLSWMRWFLRSVELASHNFRSPAMADLIYAVVVGISALCLLLYQNGSAVWAVGAQAVACLVSFFNLGALIHHSFQQLARSSMMPFMQALREHGRWALLGVVTTEATANSHSWIAGLIFGPATLAPIAAVNLFFRPVLVLTQALTQYERPRMASAIAQGSVVELEHHRHTFTRLAVLCWVATGGIVCSILLWARSLMGNTHYSTDTLWLIATIVFVTYLARVLRGGESAALQSAGLFRPLAMVTCIAAPVTLIGASLAAWLWPSGVGPMMVAVLLGEVLTCLQIRRDYRRLLLP